MVLLELAAAHVRGFSASFKAGLKSGYQLLIPPESHGAPLGALLTALLYGDGRGTDAALLATGAKEGKAAVIFRDGKGRIWRIVRELGGPGFISAFSPEAKTFNLLSEDATEIGQILRGQAGLPTRGTFERLCVFSSTQLPSRNGAPSQVPSTAPAPHRAPLDLAKAKEQLQALEKEKAVSERVEKIQFRLDGIASQLFQCESALNNAEQLKQKLEGARAAWAQTPSLETFGLPSDIRERVKSHPRLLRQRDEALSKLERERSEEDLDVAYAAEPLWTNRTFWAALAGGAVFLASGALLRGLARYLALLDIPSFGYSAWAALVYLGELERVEKTSRKDERRAARQKKIQEGFERDARPVHAAMAALKVERPEEIEELLGRKETLRVECDRLEAEWNALQSEPEFVRASAEMRQLRSEQTDLNEELRQSGYVRDSREIEREIASLRAALEPPSTVPAPKVGTPKAPWTDLSPTLLSLASDALGVDVSSVISSIRSRCEQYLNALSRRHCQSIDWDSQGRASVSVGGVAVPFIELSSQEADASYLALRMTLAEKLASELKLPLVWDDEMGLEPTQLPLLAKMLKSLGSINQVLHSSATPSLVSMADTSVKV